MAESFLVVTTSSSRDPVVVFGLKGNSLFRALGCRISQALSQVSGEFPHGNLPAGG